MSKNTNPRQVIHFSGEIEPECFESFDHFLPFSTDPQELPGGLVCELELNTVSVVKELHLPDWVAAKQDKPQIEVLTRETYDYGIFAAKSLLRYHRRIEQEDFLDEMHNTWQSTFSKRVELTAAGNMIVEAAGLHVANVAVNIKPNANMSGQNTRYLLTSRI